MNQFSTQTDLKELVSVNQLWEGILFLSVSGFLDSTKAEAILSKTLQTIQDRDAPFLIVDISNVPAIDSAVSKHIIDLNKAAALMGCECVLSGINAAVAHSMTTLNISFEQMSTRTTIGNALQYCMNKMGYVVRKELDSSVVM